MSKRLFLAIPLPQSYLEIFEKYAKQYQIQGIRWIPSQNLHITTYFIGNVNPELEQHLIEKLETLYSATQPFNLEFQKISPAPFHQPPRMIWAIFKQNPAFEKLVKQTAHVVNSLIPKLNFDKDKTLIPHITLARFKNTKITKNIIFKQPKLKPLDVSSCHLLQSQLTPDKAIYTKIKHFSFHLKNTHGNQKT